MRVRYDIALGLETTKRERWIAKQCRKSFRKFWKGYGDAIGCALCGISFGVMYWAAAAYEQEVIGGWRCIGTMCAGAAVMCVGGAILKLMRRR